MALLVDVGDRVIVLGAGVTSLIVLLALVGIAFIVGEYGPWNEGA